MQQVDKADKIIISAFAVPKNFLQEVDRVAGRRKRSAFVVQALRRELANHAASHPAPPEQANMQVAHP